MNIKPIRKLIFAVGFSAMAFSATAVASEYPDLIAGRWNFTGDQTGSVTFTKVGQQYVGTVSEPVEMLGCTHDYDEVLFQADFVTSEDEPSLQACSASAGRAVYVGAQQWCDTDGGNYGNAAFSVVEPLDGSPAHLLIGSQYEGGYSVFQLEKAPEDESETIAARSSLRQ